MIKLFISLWKNIFNFKGTIGRKEFWLSCIIEDIFMYLCVIPFGLIARLLPLPLPVISILYISVCILPFISLYARRANDVGLKLFTTIYVAVIFPIVGAMGIALLPKGFATDERTKSQPLYIKISRWILVTGFGAGIWAAIFFAIFPPVSMALMTVGLIVNSFTLIAIICAKLIER